MINNDDKLLTAVKMHICMSQTTTRVQSLMWSISDMCVMYLLVMVELFLTSVSLLSTLLVYSTLIGTSSIDLTTR